MPSNYKIPTKSAANREKDEETNTTTDAVTKHHEAAKAFLTQTLGSCGSTPYNPMDYYEEPDWDNTPAVKTDLKRKDNEPVGNI